MIISREQAGHSLGTNLMTEAIRVPKYLFPVPSVSQCGTLQMRGIRPSSHTQCCIFYVVITTALHTEYIADYY